MSAPRLVKEFYERIWNAGDPAAISDLLAEEFSFRGSLGVDLRGREAFEIYVRFVRSALADYQCEILDCVTEGKQAFAKMQFSGRHVAAFRGFSPTEKSVCWLGAALFRFENQSIADLWVLGDLTGLDSMLQNNQDNQ
jgi:predicted ester cyclase